MLRNKLILTTFTVLLSLLFLSCGNSGPSDSEIKDAVSAFLKKNGLDEFLSVKNKLGGLKHIPCNEKKFDITSIEILERGKLIEKDYKYQSFRISVKGTTETCDLDIAAGKNTKMGIDNFEIRNEWDFQTDDFGKWIISRPPIDIN